MSIFEKLRDCAYMPDMDFPERTDPDYETKLNEYVAAEAVGVEQLKADLFAQHGLTNNPRAAIAFELAYQREGYLGLHSVVDLFEELLPLIVEIH